ncbi:tubulin monoglycylase TTLL3 [Xenopus laevis]|uniref:Tubulin monoglycylase TTLL3 n=1 Tax=Xenopus laevis TaxID=8355 RepID=A0A8J1LW15_XENLA|nr:tubulin monoglycylase TTLL3 [Xenopus laevis]
MAFMVCKMLMIPSINKDIDKKIKAMDPDWTEYLEGYYQLIHAGAEIKNSATYAEPCRQVLDKIQAKLPQLDIDTGRNIWILKRAALSGGRDIICMDRVKKIIKFVQSHDSRHVEKKWVIQKYIERPFLIYNTKFDMRQFFLVTAWNPLTIWYYKENYICMSSQPFNLENLDNSIHLCNRPVQMQFKNCPTRHPELPEDNVWSNRKLQEYLCMIGAENVWEDVMVPGIKKIIYQTMQVSQNKVTHRKNSFDIYGADFMFSENFNPWLIEINSRPDMSSPTAVTGVIFKSILEDTIKVIIDRKKDPNCDIGAYELIKKQVHYYQGVNDKRYSLWQYIIIGIYIKG